jgi:import inner membrane translocase subunit TIM21
MIQNIKKKVEAEAEADEELHNKFLCYCKTGSGDLETSIAEAEAAGEDALVEAPLTTSEKVSATFWIGALILGGVCVTYTVYVLFPSSMSPNTVMDEAFSQLQRNERVIQIFGEPLKAYGQDHGGHKEGRRNFIEHREEAAKDGSKRLLIKFNIEGPYSRGFVWAQVSSILDHKSGEWVYLIVQNKKGGEITTLCDNRRVIEDLASAKTPEEKEFIKKFMKNSQKAY